MNQKNLDEWKDALAKHLLLFLQWGSSQHGSGQRFLKRSHCHKTLHGSRNISSAVLTCPGTTTLPCCVEAFMMPGRALVWDGMEFRAS